MDAGQLARFQTTQKTLGETFEQAVKVIPPVVTESFNLSRHAALANDIGSYVDITRIFKSHRGDPRLTEQELHVLTDMQTHLETTLDTVEKMRLFREMLPKQPEYMNAYAAWSSSLAKVTNLIEEDKPGPSYIYP